MSTQKDRTQTLQELRRRIENDLRDLPMMAKIALENAFEENEADDSPVVTSTGRVGHSKERSRS